MNMPHVSAIKRSTLLVLQACYWNKVAIETMFGYFEGQIDYVGKHHVKINSSEIDYDDVMDIHVIA